MARADHHVHAVTDGPSGTAVVHLPVDWVAARRLRAETDQFFCTTQAGGCGEVVTAAVGTLLVPHFRHRPGSRCRFAAGAGSAGAYAHLAYQRALESWLCRQGLEPHLEHVLDDRGRADLHVVVHSVAHSIEVQLTQLSEEVWDQRNARYASQVDHVQWLHGSVCARSRDRDLATAGNGVALEIRLAPEGGVLVGTRWLGTTAWAPLDDCRMTAGGLQTPHGAVAAAELTYIRQSRTAFDPWIREQRAKRKAAEAATAAAAAERRRQLVIAANACEAPVRFSAARTSTALRCCVCRQPLSEVLAAIGRHVLC